MSKEKFVRDKPHVNIGTVLLSVIGLVSAISLGLVIYTDISETRDSDGDTVPDLEEGNAGHPLYFDVSDDDITFKSYQTTSGSHELGHNLGISHDGTSSHVNLYLNLYDDVSTETPILSLHVQYDSLIEFVDGNGDGFFNPATDSVVGITQLNNMLRTEFGYGIDGEPAYFSAYSTIDGVFKVEFYTAREHVLLGRQIGLLNPFEVKSYISITDYTPLTMGTNLALNLSLSSNENIAFSSTESSATLAISDFMGVYEWEGTAILDGIERQVNVTSPSTTPVIQGSLYFNFGGMTNASYDPRLRWELPRLTSFDVRDLPWTYITIGSLAVLAIGLAAKKTRTASKFKAVADKVQSATPGGGYGSKPSKPGDISADAQTDKSKEHIPRKRPGRVKY